MTHFGADGNEPEQLTMLRDLVANEAPEIYSLILGDDEIAAQYIHDPGLALRQAREILAAAQA